MVKLTMKLSLIRAAKSLPSSIEDVKPGALLPGYIASVTSDAVFVRFLGSLTGRAGRRLSALRMSIICYVRGVWAKHTPPLSRRECQSLCSESGAMLCNLQRT